MPVVRLEYRSVTMRFANAKGGGPLTAVRGVSFSVRDAEVVSLIGPTGCGKSTLLNIGSGLAAPSEGAAFVDGERVAGPNAQVAFMLQKDLLLPWRTVAENVMFGVEIQGLPVKERKRRAENLLANFKLAEFSGHYPHQLSGGQQQRAAIARALAMKPKLLLYDEPTSALDPELVDEVLAVMKELDSEGITQLVVTHEMRFARDVAEKIVFMSDGAVVEQGPPEMIFSNPTDPRTRQFLKRYL